MQGPATAGGAGAMPALRHIEKRHAAHIVEPMEVPGRMSGPRRRLTGEARVEAIVGHAIDVFAEHGFDIGTRALVTELQVSQALLYRYFPSKAALVEAVLERLAAGRWRAEWDQLLAAAELPLDQRLTRFYTAYLNGTDRAAMRLFLRASLEGRGVARRLGASLTGRILGPVIDGLRREAGLEPLAGRPLADAERELAMGLHGALVFLAIRKHVYGYPLPDDLGPLVGRQIRVWLPGAVAEIRRLAATGGDAGRS